MNLKYLIVSLLICSVKAQSTIPDTAWTKTFSGPGMEWGYVSAQTADSGYIFAGRTNSFGAGSFDSWLIKTDSNGDTLWTNTYGYEGIDETYNVKQTSDGGYLLCGVSNAFGWAGEGWVIKTDESGNKIWDSAYHNINGTEWDWDYLYDIEETEDGYVLIGMSALMGAYGPNYDGWIIKISKTGTVIWNKHYGTDFEDRLFKMAETSDGGYIAAGDRWVSDGAGGYRHDGWLVRFDINGDTLWTKNFGTPPATDVFRSVVQTSTGDYIILGETLSYGVSEWNGWIVKTDINGNELVNKTVGPGALLEIKRTLDGNFVAAGTYKNSSNDGWVVKLDANTNLIWEKIFVSNGPWEVFESINLTNDGGYILSGYIQTSHEDFWLVKLEPEETLPFTSVSFLMYDDNGAGKNLLLGVSNTATDSIDIHLGESDLPPFPPAGAFEARWILPKNNFDGSLSSYSDYRFGNGMPFIDTIEYRLKYQGSTGADTIFFEWNFPEGITGRLQDLVTGSIVDISLNGIGVYGLDNFGVLNQMKLLVYYNIVPVELTSFIAEVSGNRVELRWSTATETNNMGFEIERKSTNTEFEKIGYIPGNGTTTEPKEYSFIDNKINQGSYTYRLRQIDFDGSFEYSDEITINVTGAGTDFSLSQNYPNPFNPATVFIYSVPFDSHVRITIYNTLGEVIEIVTDELKTTGVYDFRWKPENLSTGVYIYAIDITSADGESLFRKQKKMLYIK